MAGRHRLIAVIGQGAMGRVLLGRSPDGRLVAVKMIHRHLAQNPEFRARFRLEVQASQRVTGAYTAAVMDADPDASEPWLASVFVPGPSLRAAVDQFGPMPLGGLRLLTAGLASALMEIHRAGMVHRDLKPSNVLLAEDGPRVIDFGIARALEGDIQLTSTGSLIGSPAYMSPEQAEGRQLSAASDVFSVGAMLLLAATGQSPFLGASTPQTLYNVVHNRADTSRVPTVLRPVLDACLDASWYSGPETIRPQPNSSPNRRNWVRRLTVGQLIRPMTFRIRPASRTTRRHPTHSSGVSSPTAVMPLCFSAADCGRPSKWQRPSTPCSPTVDDALFARRQ
ncbi:serine/threonine protein kinase [Nocardia sp. NBC_00565]|nr:serine/threonine-protein kinase [Nocardia sp. NBC_00565]WUC01150.1 serine/threonine protein kinase [Nocardia sp. NBC_00565]